MNEQQIELYQISVSSNIILPKDKHQQNHLCRLSLPRPDCMFIYAKINTAAFPN